jgi:phosphoribosylaminoimidazole-succinocarboxamide synthase
MTPALADLNLIARGKVREMYELEDDLVMVASNRISAYDVVLPTAIPDKGRVLTQMSVFWFETTGHICPNDYVSQDVPAEAEGRGLRVKRLEMYPVECVVRGYLSGSGWREYRESGGVCGIELPEGLRESEKLPEPIFTPATKATSGHDINISEADAGAIVGVALLERLKSLTMALYSAGAAHADRCGILLADTKFEFGLTSDGEVLLIDEVMTPDSSRYWPKDQYSPGHAQPSFDKQFVRDYLEQIRWNKQPPVPSLPDDVVAKTREKYIEAFRRLSGRDLH